MCASHALLLILPALISGHPLEQRATTESGLPTYDTASEVGPSGTAVVGPNVVISASASASGAAETDMTYVTGSLSYGVDGALVTASSTSDVAAPSTTACTPGSWDAPGMATIKLSDVHLQWGPPAGPTVKNVYGSADWFNFPFWCPETEFTVYAFPNGTTSSDMGDISTSAGQVTCVLTGASTHGDIPLVRLDISNQEPFVQATDLTGTMDMNINAECGIMRPRMGSEFPSAQPSGESASVTAPVTAPSGGLSGVYPVAESGVAESGSGYNTGYTSYMSDGTSVSGSTNSGYETASMTGSATASYESGPTESESGTGLPSASASDSGYINDAAYAASDAPAPTEPTAVFVEDGLTVTLIAGGSAAVPSATSLGLGGETALASGSLSGSAVLGAETTESGTAAIKTGASGTWGVEEAPTALAY